MPNAENYRGEGDVIYLDLMANASGGDIYAGDMVVIPSSRGNAKNTATITSLTGITSSQYFIGVAEHFLSGGKTGLLVRTKGIFEFFYASGVAASTGYLGAPVFGTDAQDVALALSAANATGCPTIGNIVGVPGASLKVNTYSGKLVWVKIKPPMLKNWIYGGTLTGQDKYTAFVPGIYGPVAAQSTGMIWSGT